MVGWLHRPDGHEFEPSPGDGEGWGSLACCHPWGHKQPAVTRAIVTVGGSDGSDVGLQTSFRSDIPCLPWSCIPSWLPEMLQTWLAFSFPGTEISLFLPRALAPFWRVLFRHQAVGAGCAAGCQMGENVCVHQPTWVCASVGIARPGHLCVCVK